MYFFIYLKKSYKYIFWLKKNILFFLKKLLSFKWNFQNTPAELDEKQISDMYLNIVHKGRILITWVETFCTVEVINAPFKLNNSTW